ncbi:MAG: exopolyphosphatase [Rhodocyclales bacterium]|nr:exopolyphosphatase [Rhodocyclales bacterium]
MGYELVAAVDLGSNSFRLQVGRVVDDQIYPLDSLKEPVRLAAGLTPQKNLDGPSQLRAIEALRRFGERLRGFDAGAVRAVATNALRVAKNAPQFLAQAEAALGFPIEIIAGREEARLIYLGVAHTLPNPRTQQLVVDIGGGSTEFIIGRNIEPIELESLYMGCVGFSLQHFPRGRIEKSGMKAAELAARKELQAIVRQYRKTGWEEAVGSSGTAKALADILEMNGLSASGITRDGLERLRGLLLHAGEVGKLTLQGLRPDRVPVLPGGLAIMLAVFKEFGLERMTFSEGALRLGVLYDLLGRYHHQDLRNATVQQFMRRYQADAGQAARVAATARGFLLQLLPAAVAEEHPDAQVLDWAALMHEIGISVAHSSYHKHSAYILANADMPGFSKMDQARLSRVVLAHRGKLERVQEIMPDSPDWLLIFSLRLAVLLHRARDDAPLPAIAVRRREQGFSVAVDPAWLAASPLSASALEEEGRQWSALGMEIKIKAGRGKSQAAA